MDAKQVTKAIEGLSGIFEVTQRHTFEAYRNSKQGETLKVVIHVLDRGIDGPTRFSCYVEQEDGKTCTGNPAESMDIVLLTLHWNQLD